MYKGVAGMYQWVKGFRLPQKTKKNKIDISECCLGTEHLTTTSTKLLLGIYKRGLYYCYNRLTRNTSIWPTVYVCAMYYKQPCITFSKYAKYI